MDLPDITNKKVLVIGHPASGKTYITRFLKTPQHNVIHTDKYVKYDRKEGVYKCLFEIMRQRGPFIVEGTLGYQLLGEGLRTKQFLPDIVIEVEAPMATIERIYNQQRLPSRLPYVKRFMKKNQKDLDDYRSRPNPNPPIWHVINNVH